MSQDFDAESIDTSVTTPAGLGTIAKNALLALKSMFSGASLPAANLVGGMVALDTTNKVYWRRETGNTKWMLHKSAADALVVAKSGAYTAVVGDFEKVLVCSGTWTLSFGAAATLTDGWWIYVINDGTGTITLDPNASETINGAAALALGPGQSGLVSCDGTKLILGGIKAAEAQAAPGASSFEDRNIIINGCMRVAQYPIQNITTSPVYGQCDRFYSYYTGLTGVTGTINQNTSWNENTLSGRSYWSAMSVASGTGKVVQGQRVEAKNTKHLAGKTVSIRIKVYHDLGATTNFTVTLRRATAEDNFSGTANIGSITGDIPTGAWTYITGTVTLGSTDARNGLQVEVYNTNDTGWNGKALHTCEWQVVEGATLTPFAMPKYSDVLEQCQRYLPVTSSGINEGTAISTTQSYVQYGFKVTPRVAPTGVAILSGSYLVYNKALANGAPTGITFNVGGFSNGEVLVTTTAGSPTIANDEMVRLHISTGGILWTGCEL